MPGMFIVTNHMWDLHTTETTSLPTNGFLSATEQIILGFFNIQSFYK